MPPVCLRSLPLELFSSILSYLSVSDLHNLLISSADVIPAICQHLRLLPLAADEVLTHLAVQKSTVQLQAVLTHLGPSVQSCRESVDLGLWNIRWGSPNQSLLDYIATLSTADQEILARQLSAAELFQASVGALAGGELACLRILLTHPHRVNFLRTVGVIVVGDIVYPRSYPVLSNVGGVQNMSDRINAMDMIISTPWIPTSVKRVLMCLGQDSDDFFEVMACLFSSPGFEQAGANILRHMLRILRDGDTIEYPSFAITTIKMGFRATLEGVIERWEEQDVVPDMTLLRVWFGECMDVLCESVSEELRGELWKMLEARDARGILSSFDEHT
ncbi:hypothetical protein K440DRAFT_332759 [Wilcoxina mikolae CBS 423.85]|nr:hypothetical protein K440DRAFT_332759 [Wilcoxina mikolae CBS 423.85]